MPVIDLIFQDLEDFDPRQRYLQAGVS